MKRRKNDKNEIQLKGRGRSFVFESDLYMGKYARSAFGFHIISNIYDILTEFYRPTFVEFGGL